MMMRRTIGTIRLFLLFQRYNVKLVLRAVKDDLVLFAIVFVVLGTPVWLGYLLFFIFKWNWAMAMATGYLFFFNVIPCTPYIGICILVTLGLKKLYKLLFK